MKTRTLLRWHSRIGILVCAWILLLACTGLVLQHSHRLGLDKPLLSGALWYSLADVPVPRVTGVADMGVYQIDNLLISRHGQLAQLDGEAQGLVKGEESMLVIDLAQLWLLTAEGELVDSLPLDGFVLVGVSEEGLPLLKGKQGRLWQLDWWLETKPELTDANLAQGPVLFVETSLPEEIEGRHSGVSVERLVLALHNGRIFGAFGEWLMSAVALMAIGIACSGFVIWGRRR